MIVVSNPIREYLQITFTVTTTAKDRRFKPYKGVSSNGCSCLFNIQTMGSFKPYKGVSSNTRTCLCLSLMLLVSNPIREYLQIYENTPIHTGDEMFQTL